MNTKSRQELLNLLEGYLEGNISQEELTRIETLVLSSPEGRRLYMDFMQLHGNLYWDAAGCGADSDVRTIQSSRKFSSHVKPIENLRRRKVVGVLTAAAILICVGLMLRTSGSLPFNQQTASNGNNTPANTNPASPSVDVSPDHQGMTPEIVRVQLPSKDNSDLPGTEQPVIEKVSPDLKALSFDPSSDLEVVSFINQELRKTLDDHDVRPSPRSEETEWIRRVHLDLAGRIPTSLEVETFLNQTDPNKRALLLDSLLESRDFASHFATIWTTLLVGRSTDRVINRKALYTYLENQFGNNQPWSETVTDLITAEGPAHQSGPTNFLLAHLNNEAVPATAMTARIFLCQQIQCTQCHRHPTAKDWGQEKFWEFNAFFQKTSVKQQMFVDEKTGQTKQTLELVEADSSQLEPSYYLDLRGVMKVAYPRFDEVEIHPEENLTLRDQLAQLLTSEDDSQLAKAFVNRSWLHFFGHAFTRQVDDMGPHHQTSHPELLDGVSKAFASNQYDVRRLIRWICLSDAYHYTSTPIAENKIDDPDAGETPLFSRMYLKPLSPEQIFNSLMVASGVSPDERRHRGSTFAQREEWMQQFFSALENEENGELSTFDGSLSQTLMMMNGELIQKAIDPQTGHVLREILSDRNKSETDRIQDLCLAALSRYPTKQELESIRKMLRNNLRQRTSRNVPSHVAYTEAFRDVYWAYLNSSEFSVNH